MTGSPSTIEQERIAWVRLNEQASQETLIPLPLELQRYYRILDDGRIVAFGNPGVEHFMTLWDHLHRVGRAVQLAMGNALVHAQEQFGDEFVNDLMHESSLSYWTYRQRMSVARRVPPENQDPTISYSRMREVARLDPPQQTKMIARIKGGEFESAKQVRAAVKVVLNEPPDQTYAPPLKLACPICGEKEGWSYERLRWVECAHCGAHADEIVDRAREEHAVIISFARTGCLDELSAFIQKYGLS